MDTPFNVLGGPLKSCSHQPLTGWFRDGCCNTDPRDRGSHTVCCRVTKPFLEFLREGGNDLITPAMQYGFPGLRSGDQWCVCAQSWRDAFDKGLACPVYMEGTHQKALDVVELDMLLAHAIADGIV